MVSMRQIVLRWIADSPHLDHPLKVAAVLMYFYAFALRLFRSLVVSAKLPGLLDLGKKVLQEDKVLVISLISTGESCTTDGVKNAVDFDDSDFEDEDEEMIAENSLPSAPGVSLFLIEWNFGLTDLV